MMEDLLDGLLFGRLDSFMTRVLASAITPEIPFLPTLAVLPRNLSRNELEDGSF